MIKPELKSRLEAIIDFLKSRYGATALILVGSRAIGDYKPNSDWDIYLFTDQELPNETPNEFTDALPDILKEEDLDVYKYSLDVVSYPAKLWRDLRNSEVILDTEDGFADKLREKAISIYRKGPDRWTKEYAQGRVFKARRYMNKLEDNFKDKNYAELFLRISWHYSENIIDWWFGIRNEWPLRPQEAFPYIEKEDPEFYGQLKIVVDETNYKSKIEAFSKIHSILFESEQFKKLIE